MSWRSILTTAGIAAAILVLTTGPASAVPEWPAEACSGQPGDGHCEEWPWNPDEG